MIKLGIVDCDSSHSVEFARRLNGFGVERDQFVHGARITSAWSEKPKSESDRSARFIHILQSADIEFVSNPDELLDRVDAVLVLSVSGLVHAARSRPFLEAQKPIFVDKPFTCDSGQARKIVDLSQQQETLMWSASALRFSEDVLELSDQAAQLGGVLGAVTFGPARRDPANPGFFHYMIHPVETLFTLIGPGCVSVSAHDSEQGDVITGVWTDGRIGTVRGDAQGRTPYGALLFTPQGPITRSISARYAYRNLCTEIVTAFQSGRPPVPLTTTFEIVRFLEAANQSARQGGQPVSLHTSA